MVVTLFFDADKRKKSVMSKYASEIERGDVIWTHLQIGEDRVLDEILKELGQDVEFREDLLEEQRPRFNRFKGFDILVIGVPSKGSIETEKDGVGIEQIAFIIRQYRLISVSKTKIPIFDRLMKKLSRHKGRLNVSYILSEILDEITEHIIDIVDYYESRINYAEKMILSGELQEKILLKSQTMRENLFYVSKILKANAEAIARLMIAKKRDVVSGQFNRNIKNRMLYAVDSVDTIRVSVKSLTELYLSLLSHRMNRSIYRLTILGTILLVPTFVSGFWGMNVKLPPLTFWQLVILSGLLSLVSLGIMKVLKWI